MLLLLLASCLPVIAADTRSATPLADAAKRQDGNAIEAILAGEVDVDAAHADGMTALHWAVYHDNAALVRQLIAAGSNVAVENRYGVQPLSVACKNGNAEIVAMLLDAGADPNVSLRGGETALMTASRTGKRGPVELLVEHGANVDAKERSGQTALMWAAAAGNVPAIEALVEAGADFRKSLKSGFEPVFFAAREGHGDAVFTLLQAGIDISEVMKPERGGGGGMSLLMFAVENGHFELAARLLRAGADPNDDRARYTALHALTWVRKPLRGDGDPPPIGSGNLSSLDLVRDLVAHGADVNARHGRYNAGRGRLNRTDATPLLLAAETGDLPLIKLLVEFGADPTITNSENCTPLLAAAGVGVLSNGDETAGTEEEAIATIEYLLSLGADINAVDDNGNAAMHGAAYKSWTKLVDLLSEHGADVDVWDRKNSRGWTPLMIAQGHRPGNFRPSAETETAVRQALDASEQ